MMTSPLALRNLPPPDIEGTRPSRETISSSTEAATKPLKASKGGRGKPPLRLPILIVRAVVILASLGLLAVQFVAGSANGPRLIAATATVGAVALVWNGSHCCLCMLRYLLVEPSRWFKARLAIDMAIVIGSFLCVGVVLENKSSSRGQIEDIPVYLATLFIIGGGTIIAVMLVLIQKRRVKQELQFQRFVQPSRSTAAPPIGASQGGGIKAELAPAYMKTSGVGVKDSKEHQRATGGTAMV
ncbi:hypothetical protein CC79DRAFT_1371154 [Sarocladium strictum]